MTKVKDRVPTYPNRVKLTPVSGQVNTYDMVRADAPIVEGTQLNKALFDDIAFLEKSETARDFFRHINISANSPIL